MTSSEENEIKALVNLLDDPDETIYSEIKNKLISYGEDIIPTLESAWEYQHDFGELFQERVENIIHSIQFTTLTDRFKNWLKKGSNDLLEGMILVSKFQYPELDETKIKHQIEQLEQDVWLELNNQLTALEKVRIINHILFEVHGFKGNKEDYHNIHNSFINDVLETKKGNPISLAVLYSIIAQKHQIPLYGINLPKHFILAYLDVGPYQLQKLNENPSVLFYVNPFSYGSVFSKREIDEFLKELKIEPQPHYYFPCSNIDIIRRVINNLLYTYATENKDDKVKELKEILTLLIKDQE